MVSVAGVFSHCKFLIDWGFLTCLCILPTMWHDVKYLDTSVCVAGLSLKSQELTAIFLAVRLYCSFVMEYDIHTLLDSATFITTAWVIYTMRFKLKSTLMEDLDNLPLHYVVCLLVLLGGFIH
jgi:hypothetical protein